MNIIPLSVLDWQIAVGVDLSSQDAKLYYITNEEHDDIVAWVSQFNIETEKVEKIIIEYVEWEFEKRQRIFDEFISSPSIDDFDWQGIELSTEDYNNLIVARDFGGDSWSQVAILTKSLFKMMGILIEMGVPVATIQTVFTEELAMARKISDSRVALWLSTFDIPF